MPDAGPSGCAQSAPSTCRHHDAPATARVGGKSSGRNAANTNDQPNTSASVRWPVAATNAANCVFVTAYREMEKAESRTACAGPSPSAGYP